MCEDPLDSPQVGDAGDEAWRAPAARAGQANTSSPKALYEGGPRRIACSLAGPHSADGPSAPTSPSGRKNHCRHGVRRRPRIARLRDLHIEFISEEDVPAEVIEEVSKAVDADFARIIRLGD